MDGARWQRIQEIFHDASALPVAERDRFVRTICSGDSDLAAEVLGMLKHDSGDGLLDQNLAQTAHKTLSAPDPLVTKEFGPYHIIRLLGEGGMGVVYLAERRDLDTQVAIKVLRDAWLSPARRERFQSEQRTLAQLNHPSIARLYDAAVLPDGTPYFVMEYIEGVPLTQYCRDKKCSVEQRLQLFRAVCEAVQHAHSNAVIHRDLKPSNILVKTDGSMAAGFRDCQADRGLGSRSRSDHDRVAADDAGICLARADSRRANWDQHGRLFAGRDPLRTARGRVAVRLVQSDSRRSRQHHCRP